MMNAPAKELNVLMIGNSFSISVTRHLDKIVRAVPGNDLYLASMYIGGCPFDRHWNNVLEGEKNPDFKPYKVGIRDTKAKENPKEFSANIVEMLKSRKWDIVTIQQASPKSWDYSTFQPYADNLIDLIHKLAPQAEIIVQQTWSYRSDDGRINPANTKGWGFDQTGMYERIDKAYRELAEKHKLRVIPTGLAVQNFRNSLQPEQKFKPLTKEETENYKGDKIPDQSGDIVGNYSLRKGKLGADTIHLNKHGEYLQGCVWFNLLYGIDPQESASYRPIFLKATDAALLRKCAADAVRDYKQVK